MKRVSELYASLNLDQPAPHALRRRLLKAALACAASAMFAPPLARQARAAPSFASDPYTLGVASGAPRANSVVLWTRLAPAPLAGGGMPPESVDIRWEVARDEAFRDIAAAGSARAEPEQGHSVHVEVRGLAPERWYWYRFMAGDAVSPIGRTRTAALPQSSPERLAFAIASCQQYEQGYYAAYRHMAAENLDLVVFVGDYIYESSWGSNHVRKHSSSEPRTLEEYRVRYAQYKSDPDLQRMHASAPWLVTWDDHEVANDYANDRGADLDPNFIVRRAAAYRAYWEHMPLAAASIPQGPAMRIYDRYEFGDLAQFYMLDDRQYRTYQACQRPGRGGSSRVTECSERLDPARTLLGMEQERWLEQSLATTRARWNVIAQQTLMAQLALTNRNGRSFWTDGWDGYPAARARLLGSVAQLKPRNPLVLGGDVHCTWVADLKSDFDDPRSPVIATELCGTSITSQGPTANQVRAELAENPHLRYGNGTQRGYLKVELGRSACRALVRTLDNVKRADSGISTAAAFTVEDGRTGAQPA